MDHLGILALSIFGIGYIIITLEHKLSTNKSAVALALGAILWVLASFVGNQDVVSHYLHDAAAEIFQIVAFLIAAMALVEILVHYQFFDLIRTRLAKLNLKDRGQFLVMGGLTFFLSAILDNLTVTIVMIQIARHFFKDKNLLIAAAGIVILANAGGAWSPIGDVTTIMLWLAKKFSALEIITYAFIPSFLLGITSLFMLSKQMKDTKADVEVDENITLSKSEKTVVATTLASFSFPILMNFMGLPPYLGLLLGLGVVWAMIEFAKKRSRRVTHLEANIDRLLQKVDIASIKFFIGILLSVSALHVFGVLEMVSHFIFGADQNLYRIVFGTTLIGLLSAIVDNVPLTALSIDLIKSTDPYIWSFLALCVGTGGSALVIGSVAGVVAMGMVKEMTFGAYLKIATLPALAGYFVAVVSYTLMFFVF